MVKKASKCRRKASAAGAPTTFRVQAMKMILTAGVLTLALMAAAISAVHAKALPPPADEAIAQPIIVGE